MRSTSGKPIGSKIEHLEAVWKMTGVKPKELEFPDPDQTVLHLLSHFYKLRKAEKLSYTEISNYCQLLNVDLCSWQIDAIMKLDSIFESSIYG